MKSKLTDWPMHGASGDGGGDGGAGGVGGGGDGGGGVGGGGDGGGVVGGGGEGGGDVGGGILGGGGDGGGETVGPLQKHARLYAVLWAGAVHTVASLRSLSWNPPRRK